MPDPIALSSEAELRALIERALSANYEIDREIGRGGMGIVYRARDRRLKRTVAIKLLPPELAFRSEIKSRFLREAETAAQLSHPNIVPIYSVDEREGLVFFVMTCVEGVTLAQRLAEVGQLDVDESRRVLREVADALSYAHGRGVVHRDIKPDNILLDRESGRAMVTDFGIARAVQESGDSRLTATGVAIGTPAFMSPEQAAGDREIDGRSDLYSLGVVGYLALSGQLPFTANSTPSMLMKHLSERPIPVSQYRPDTPPDLGATVMTLLEKEPDRRFPNASALSLALQGDESAIPRHATSEAGAADNFAPYVTVSPPAAVPFAAPSVLPAHPAFAPTPDEIARWSAPEVNRFRTSFRKFGFWVLVFVVLSVFADHDFLSIPVIAGVVMAFKYSKLLEAGYDWHDVFKQPQDRSLIDVAGDAIDETRGLFDRTKREQSRRSRQSLAAMPRAQLPPRIDRITASPLPAGIDYGPHSGTVHVAEQNRADILRQVNGLPKSDQQLVAGVIPAAEALLDRIRALAGTLVPLERADPAAAGAGLDGQIAALEAQANPFEVGSEARVKRLALLKRQRRGLVDDERQRDQARAKLESCALALQNMRLDILRLRAGGVGAVTPQITQLTERARSLADEVDAAVLGADEAARLAAVPSRRRQRDQA